MVYEDQRYTFAECRRQYLALAVALRAANFRYGIEPKSQGLDNPEHGWSLC